VPAGFNLTTLAGQQTCMDELGKALQTFVAIGIYKASLLSWRRWASISLLGMNTDGNKLIEALRLTGSVGDPSSACLITLEMPCELHGIKARPTLKILVSRRLQDYSAELEGGGLRFCLKPWKEGMKPQQRTNNTKYVSMCVCILHRH
jgi:hypothetical protein